ncbi:MAG: anaerobic ribonucleoside-triphosphate reductase activating protein [Peptostreptococcaceae bacterium]|nr:anaerobic ribonucleoside-triphosphate reductase activating protein [Peptostreptococcaceae bacterium]
MNIQGLQKLSLLDYPTKVSCTIFTGGCNFRCPFCHNASLVLPEQMVIDSIDIDSVFSFLKKRKNVLEAVCISGGEPLVQPDLEYFLKSIKEMGYLIKLDTNGAFPDLLQKIVEKKLVDYVAMDIKNSIGKYCVTIGVPSFDTKCIETSVEYLLNNPVEYEFRTTLVRKFHKTEDLIQIGKWIHGTKRYFLQSFVDSGNLIENDLSGYNDSEMKQFQELLSSDIPGIMLRGV